MKLALIEVIKCNIGGVVDKVLEKEVVDDGLEFIFRLQLLDSLLNRLLLLVFQH